MRLLLLLAICIGASVATSLRFAPTNEYLTEQWELFKSTFKRSYESKEQEAIRRIVFESNLRLIHEHNLEADLGRHTFWLGVNQFADLTKAEFEQRMLGLRINGTRPRQGSTFLPPANIALPAEVDWRKKGYVTPVKNQDPCETCWAFSTTGALEGQHFRKTKKLVSLSEQNLVDCFDPFDFGCYGGSDPEWAFNFIKKNRGIDTEASYPYRGMTDACHFKRKDIGATDQGFKTIPQNEHALKQAVATVGPISVGIDATYIFKSYKHGILVDSICGSTRKSLNHAVLVVGYGTENGQDYWIVKNSWGSKWGEAGYIRMARNRNNMCGIATHASYPLV